MKTVTRTPLFVFSIAAAILGSAADLDLSKLPPPTHKKVDFVKDIKPLLEKTCLKCHGPERPKSKYRMDTRKRMIKGGGSKKAAIKVGKSAGSPLVHFIADLVKEMEMPPLDKRKKYGSLNKDQIGLLRAWIDQGAKWPKKVKLKYVKAQ